MLHRTARTLFAVGLLVLAAALLAAIPAHAQYYGQNKVQYRTYDWRSIESDHFDVYFYPGLDSLAMRVLDLAEKTHVVMTARLGHPLTHRVPIILYGSHNDFAQTNVTPETIDPGTGGFTEIFRNRVVLPFTGSYEDLRHVVVHELTHAYMFDLLYGGSATALIARQSFYTVPLWFAEGLAEHISLGMEPNAEMFLRDGTVEGYLPPLSVSGGYLVYKQGQSAIAYLVERHGEERLRDLLRKIRQTRNFDRAFQRSMGTTVDTFDRQWRVWLRRQYWPTVASKQDPEQFARPLTNHRHDESNFNTAPSVSPQGDRIAYFSDRRQYTDVYVMSAFDGKVLRRVIRGEQSVQFESIPSFRSSITWSPDGGRLALTAKSAGRDVLYIVSARTGKVLHRFDLHCDALAYPAWSPKSDTLVVVGVKDGRSDLWLVSAASGRSTRLTDDTWDEKEPTWTPDGGTVTFASDRLAPVVLNPLRQQKGYGAYGLFDLELASGRVAPLLDTFGDDHAPAWSPDGRKLAFISDRSGTPNILLWDRIEHTFTQLTDVAGGVSSLSWSRQNDRLVFSAFNRGGFDVFAVKEPVALDPVLARLRRQTPAAVIPAEMARSTGVDTVRASPGRGALAGTWPDTAGAIVDTTKLAAVPLEPAEPPRVRVDSAYVFRSDRPAWAGGPPGSFPVFRDTLAPLPSPTPLVERGGAFALPDSVLGQPAEPYRVRLSPDYAGGGVIAAAGYGFEGSTQLVFSDFLGNHNLYVATNLFGGSLEETNALAIYNYLPRRWDFGGGLFHFKNYYSARVTTLGEQLGSPRLFSERNFGALAEASYPFDRFRRVELNFIQMFVERKFYEEDEFGDVFQVGKEYRSVSSPGVSLVGDNSLFGYYGPVNGHRYNLTFSPSFAWFRNGLAYQTVTLDARRYWDLTHGYTFAGRVLAGRSGGRDAQQFQVGGFATLRGYDEFEVSLQGSRLAVVNAELRFPFIQQLGLVGPVPIGIFHLRGAVFGDAGIVWDEGEPLRFTHVVDGKRALASPHLGFGVGIRTAVAFLLLKLDTAWNTDLAHVSEPRWHFSIGPEF